MEIAKIYIQNIASIGEATVDLTAPPLAGESLFLICGQTGAGKSTLIDAVCLALYGKVPRFEMLKRESVEAAENELSATNDARHLLRKGTGEGMAAVWFRGVDGFLYKATWKVRRARNKPNGKFQAVERTLANMLPHGQEEVLSAQLSVVEKLVPEVVGLTFEQFTRTLVLAQGQFAKFLQANENEKAEILEMLTDTGIYSEISRRIFLHQREELNKLNALQTQIGSVPLLEEEEKTALLAEQGALEQRRKDVEAQSKIVEGKRLWHKTRVQLEQAVAELETRQAAEKKRWLDASADGYLIRVLDALGEVPVHLNKQADAEKALAVLRDTTLPTLRHHFATLCATYEQLRTLLDNPQEAVAAVDQWAEALQDPQVVGHGAPLGQTGSVGAMTTLLLQLKRGKLEGVRFAAAMDRLAGQIKQQEDGLPALVQTLERAQCTLEAAAKALAQAREQEQRIDWLALRKQQERLDESSQKLTTLAKQSTDYAQQQRELRAVEDRLKRLREQQQDKEKECKAAEAEFARCVIRQEQAEQAYNVARDLATPSLKNLRASLETGAPCPLCGAKEHPYLSGADILHEVVEQLDAGVADYKRTLSAATAQREELNGRLSGARAALGELAKQCARAVEEVEAHRTSYAAAHEAFEQAATALFPGMDWAHLAEAIDLQRAKNEEQRIEVERQFTEGEKLRTLAHQTQQTWEQAAQAVTEAQQAKEKEEKTLDAFRRERLHQEDNWKDRATAVRQVQTDLVNRLQTSCDQSAELLAQLLQKTTYQLMVPVTLGSESAPDPEAMDGVATALRQLSQQFETVLEDQLRWNATLQASCQAVDQWMAWWNSQEASDPPVSQTMLRSWLALPTQEISRKRRNILQIQQDLASVGSLLADKEEALKKHLDGEVKPLAAETDVFLQETEAALLKQQQNTLNALVAIQAKLRMDAENQGRLRELFEARQVQQAVFDQWDFLQAAFGQADGSKLKKQAQSYTLHILLRYANKQLAQLTGQYQLVGSANSLSISVIDGNMANEVRPVSTLSGGETFLVSLALALGLSSLNQERIPIGTLFIDEGFGTLDAPTLETVMTALENLYKQGRKVGIISHVPALKERIPTQIRVIKTGSGGCSRVEITSEQRYFKNLARNSSI